MLTIKIDSVKSKPTGHVYNGVITMGSDYLNWKKKQVQAVKKQLPPYFKTYHRVSGVVARIVLPPRYQGHRPDMYNLIGSIADILTQAGIWRDDNVEVSDLCHMKISYNSSRLSIVNICETVLEYREEVNKVLDTLVSQ